MSGGDSHSTGLPVFNLRGPFGIKPNGNMVVQLHIKYLI